VTLRRLVLWRHGQTADNAAGRFQGQADVPLSAIGEEQAHRAARLVAALRPEIALTSDLRRATSTAAAFTALTGIPAGRDKRLREMSLGDWQDCTEKEVERGWPQLLAKWRVDPEQAPPGGESQVEVAARAYETVQELDLACDGTALVCCHGGVIRLLTARLLGLPVEVWSGLAVINNCNWTLLARRDSGDGRWRLVTYNGGPAE
jgi:broad specificity phosphatase PhoE